MMSIVPKLWFNVNDVEAPVTVNEETTGVISKRVTKSLLAEETTAVIEASPDTLAEISAEISGSTVNLSSYLISLGYATKI
jgi:hypothetical protein